MRIMLMLDNLRNLKMKENREKWDNEKMKEMI